MPDLVTHTVQFVLRDDGRGYRVIATEIRGELTHWVTEMNINDGDCSVPVKDPNDIKALEAAIESLRQRLRRGDFGKRA